MNKKEIFQKIEGIIADLNEQYHYLSQNSESLNEPEMELFIANADFLSDHLIILKKLNEHSIKATPYRTEYLAAGPGQKPAEAESALNTETAIEQKSGEAESISATASEAETEQIPGEELEKEPGFIVGFEKREEGQSAGQSLTELDKAGVETHKDEAGQNQDHLSSQVSKPGVSNESELVIQGVVLPEKTIVIAVEKPVDAVNEKMPKQTINDLLSAKAARDTIAGTYSHQPIKDLKSVISLNDKLLFVKDLFNGYSLAYSEAIELVNRLDSMEAADKFLKLHYAAKNNWPDKQATADKFYEILGRRFTKGEF